uniref:Mechanosensitive ion channel MscS domain-containing protein n=1 Tax=Spongospora subterranea TaxID=70186 RepID=A0A0H5R5D5_9EUKA|eukprot:CRZ09375.1 hypothetical protein [Spongospora subterranea]
MLIASRFRHITPLVVGRIGVVGQRQRLLSSEAPKENVGRLSSVYMRVLPISDDNLKRMVSQGLAVGTYGVVATSLLGTIGVDTAPLLAGLGGAGVTLGFALKDVAANAIAGLSLVVERPFKTGDVVRIGPEKARGRVMVIGYRYVHLDMLNEKNQVLNRIMIPSCTVHSNAIIVEPPIAKDK